MFLFEKSVWSLEETDKEKGWKNSCSSLEQRCSHGIPEDARLPDLCEVEEQRTVYDEGVVEQGSGLAVVEELARDSGNQHRELAEADNEDG